MSTSRTTTMALAAALLLAAGLLPVRAAAQAAPAGTREVMRQAESRLTGRVDADTRRAILGILDSAMAAGLPLETSERLVTRALQGAMSPRATPPMIVAAVRSHARRLMDARAALGPGSFHDEIDAGAAALLEGAQPATLRALKSLRPRSSVAVPLVVLVDLVAQGVPPDTASALILSIAQRQAQDATFNALRAQIATDIGTGALPVVAASSRTRGVLSGSPAATTLNAVGTDANVNGPQRSSPGTTPRPPGAPPPRP